MDKHTESEANQNQNELDFGFASGITDVDDDGRVPPRDRRAAGGSRLDVSVVNQPAGLRQVTAWNITEWAHLPLKAAEIDPVELDRQVELMRSFGQTRPVIVRPTPNRPGMYEAIGSAWIAAVAARLSEQMLDSVFVQVDVRHLTDEDAFAIAGQELESGPGVSSYSRGLFYAAAVERFGSQQAAARACATSEAALSKNLDVARAAALLGDKILIRLDLRQRDCAWLMGIIGREADGSDAPDADARNRMLTALVKVERGPARKVFAALRSVGRTEKAADQAAVFSHAGRNFGLLRSNKGGAVRIDLDGLGEIELDVIVEHIREKLATLLRASTF